MQATNYKQHDAKMMPKPRNTTLLSNQKFVKSIGCLRKGGPAVSNTDILEESFIKPSCMQQKNVIQNKVSNINKILESIQPYKRGREYKMLFMFWQTNHFNRIRSSFASGP